ncbi:Lrp/AsnC family transcriptional regulator [Gulosibacter sp. 10]|uniref:Lrp/AsnC family transcriptional regulator n=1 Tax=Gulosibacter sp. 10 TaxID=1255570 RepID=UPI00097F28F4|nr:Lrp/AsnC family transcriptional regulator [Gulosibacter sp. 10]SJM63672.1 Transcriptional regulator, AsnC family [Gulosibacter sp. 10]
MRKISRNDRLYEPSILDDEDAMLIHALQIAPRASWAELGAVLGVHPSTLATRWQRIVDAGVAWVSAHPIGTRTNPMLVFIEVRCGLAVRETVIGAFSRFPEIVSIDISARDRDMLLTVSADSIESVSEWLMPEIAKIPGVVHLDISMVTRLHFGGDGFRMRALGREQQRAAERLAPRRAERGPASRIHPDVLRALVYDGRRPAADIARELGLAEATVRRQIRSALARDVLRLRCDVSQDMTGLPVTCQWYGALPAALHDAAAEAISHLPGLRLCASTTGRTNFFIVMWLRSVGDVLAVEQELAAAVPELELRENAVALQIVKRVGWLLGEGGRATGEVVPPRWGLPRGAAAARAVG